MSGETRGMDLMEARGFDRVLETGAAWLLALFSVLDGALNRPSFTPSLSGERPLSRPSCPASTVTTASASSAITTHLSSAIGNLV